MTRTPVIVDFRFHRWAWPLFVAGAALGVRRLTDWLVAHGTYFDYEH